MNRRKYLLSCLSEENGEVIQESCKAIRFGLDDINPKTKESNANAIHREMIDVIAVYLMVFENEQDKVIDINNLSCNIINEVIKKQEKVEKWLNYSIDKAEVTL